MEINDLFGLTDEEQILINKEWEEWCDSLNANPDQWWRELEAELGFDMNLEFKDDE